MSEALQQTEWAEPRKRASAGRAIWRVLTFPFRIFEHIVHGIAYLVVIALIVVGIGTGLFNWWASAPMQIAPQTAGGVMPPEGMSLKALLDHSDTQEAVRGLRKITIKYTLPMAVMNVLTNQGAAPDGPQARDLEKALGFPVPWNEINGSLGDKIHAMRYLADNATWSLYVKAAKAAGCFDLGAGTVPAKTVPSAAGA